MNKLINSQNHIKSQSFGKPIRKQKGKKKKKKKEITASTASNQPSEASAN